MNRSARRAACTVAAGKEENGAMGKKTPGKDLRGAPPKNTVPVRASGNLLDDRGYSSRTETRLRFDLAGLIRAVIESRALRQIDVASLVAHYAPGAGISQGDVSRIVRGNLDGYSVLRLIVILAALGNDVSIVVQPAGKRGRISVLDGAVGYLAYRDLHAQLDRPAERDAGSA